MEIANVIKRGYSIGREFLKVVGLFFYKEDIHEVLIREGIDPEVQPNAYHPHGQVLPPHSQVLLFLLMVLKSKI